MSILKNTYSIKNYITAFITLLFFAILLCSASPAKANEYSLSEGYEFYKANFFTEEGRVVDPRKDNITTSEGQSYILLMSLAMNDKSTFNKAYEWTKNNLQQDNYLFGWLWGKDKDGNYRVLDKNSASDADIDIAFALLKAYEKWKEEKYLSDAKQIIKSIWKHDTKEIYGQRVLYPGATQRLGLKDEINPSYLSPYTFKTFQQYDKSNDWNRVVDSSYKILNMATKSTKTGLPPDWVILYDDKLVLEDGRSNFSYDAIRVFPRVFVDYKLTKDKRALPILKKSHFFIKEWKKDKNLYTNFKPNGEVKDKHELIGSISLLIPVINMHDKKKAKQIYENKILANLKDKNYFDDKKGYYTQSLLWFGMYLYQTDLKKKH